MLEPGKGVWRRLPKNWCVRLKKAGLEVLWDDRHEKAAECSLPMRICMHTAAPDCFSELTCPVRSGIQHRTADGGVSEKWPIELAVARIAEIVAREKSRYVE
jgi:hypothetical protein